ncbi:MAG: hypothetical protein HZC40_13745 [Chloroflexi bacterium]|nr:hypothetical protein [Chloroflexota bacterium]
MPFAKRNHYLLPWELSARGEKEFAFPIQVCKLRDTWTRTLKTLDYGVLIVRRYTEPLVVVGAPRIWFNVLSARIAHQPNLFHPLVYREIERALETAKRVPGAPPFTPIRLSVRGLPDRLSDYLTYLNMNEVVVGVHPYRRAEANALVMPFTALKRFWSETENAYPSEWANEMLDWTRRMETGRD